MVKVKNCLKWLAFLIIDIPLFVVWLLEFAVEILYYHRIRKDEQYDGYLIFLCELHNYADPFDVYMEILDYKCNYLSFKLEKAFIKFGYFLDEC